MLLISSTILKAQIEKPNSISASYFGESLTHPGLKIGVSYHLKSWDKAKKGESFPPKIINKSFDLGPYIGFYYHKDYQTGIFILPEFSYTKKNTKGNFLTFGLGAGYMRTIIPNVYEINSNNEIEKTSEGNNYFLTNYFILFGKDLSIKHKIPLDIFLKPQIMYAMPNYPKGITYFAIELGVGYKLIKGEMN
jgi:hypothetical protein